MPQGRAVDLARVSRARPRRGRHVQVWSAPPSISRPAGANVTTNDEIMNLVRDLESGNAWAVGRFDVLTVAGESSRRRQPAIFRRSRGSRRARTSTAAIRGVVRAEARDEEAANGLRDVVRGFMALGEAAGVLAARAPDRARVARSWRHRQDRVAVLRRASRGDRRAGHRSPHRRRPAPLQSPSRQFERLFGSAARLPAALPWRKRTPSCGP